MKPLLWTGLLCLGIAGPLEAIEKVSPSEAIATLSTPADLQVQLFASEPMFVNPTAIDIDPQGRVWVCEAVNYRRQMRNQPPLRKEGDRIVILEDRKGTGQADTVHVFYQGPDLIAPLGIAVAKDAKGPGYKVFVCQSPHIWLFEDKDGDLKADGPPKPFLTGFGGIDHDHGVHSILIGPDGKLYFTVGDSGVTGLQSRDGQGRKWVSNKSDDCRAGTVWRCDLDGTHLELIAHNFRNNYEVCLDSFGGLFLSDNDDDGQQQTRLCFVMPGGNYGYYPRGPGQSHWHEEQPGIVHKILRTGFGSPCGICFYEGSLLPKRFHGQLLHADAGPRELRCFTLQPKGAGFSVEKENLITSTDTWFRPVDVCVAPDGSVFVADWYDPGVGGHGMGDIERGRLFRVTPKGHTGYKVPTVTLDTQAGVLDALLSPSRSVRAVAQDHLRSLSQAEVKKTLAPLLQGERGGRGQALALWQTYGRRDAKDAVDPKETAQALKAALTSNDPNLQLMAVRFYQVHPGAIQSLVTPDEARQLSTAVRREILLACRTQPASEVVDLIRTLAKLYDGQDRFYLNAIGIAVGSDPQRREVLLKDFDQHFPGWNDRVAGLVFELRPPSILAKLGPMLQDASLTPAQRGQIVDILAAASEPTAGQTLLKLLGGDLPLETQAKIVENLRLFLPGKWTSLRKSSELPAAVKALLAKPETIRLALTLIGAGQQRDAIDTVAALAKDATQPLDLRRDAVRTLSQVPSADAVAALNQLTSDKLLSREAVRALGGLMPTYGDPTKQPAAKEAFARLQSLITGKDIAVETAVAALEALSLSRAGTQWLLERHAQKQLPEPLLADAGRLLRSSPFQDLRNKAMIAFPAPGKIDPKNLPAIADLLKRKGNAENGRQLLTASLKSETQCLKCHMVRGLGGAIGPDLSMIGKKGSRENLFESILYPSKAIADQYINWQIETTQGQVLVGLIVQESPTAITIRDANGKDAVVETKAIESRTKLAVSIMPGDIVAGLSIDELVDMVEYLQTLQTPALTFDAWKIVGPFPNGPGDAGLDQDHGPEKAIDLKASYPGKDGAPLKWRTIKPDSGGYVDLKAFFAPHSDQIVSYLTRTIESPAEQDAEIRLGTDDAATLFVNGQKVWSTRKHLAAVPERDRVKVKLNKGRNTLLLKITNGDGEHGFYLTVLSEQELKAVPLPP